MKFPQLTVSGRWGLRIMQFGVQASRFKDSGVGVYNMKIRLHDGAAMAMCCSYASGRR